MRVRSKLFFSIFVSTMILVIALSGVVYFQVSRTIKSMVEEESIVIADLILQTADVSYRVNQHAVRQYLEVAGYFVQEQAERVELTAVDQIARDPVERTVPAMYVRDQMVTGGFELVDLITELTGGTVRIFQTIPEGLLRVSTSVRNAAGEWATGTCIPSTSPVDRYSLSRQPTSFTAVVRTTAHHGRYGRAGD